jgi:RNA recognition motif-containing protein
MMLKLSKCGKLVKRRLHFDLKRIDLSQIDKCTVYVENFPDSLSIQNIAKIFSRAGEIRNITLPKFGTQNNDSAMDTDESVSLTKGFCFVEFAST